MARVPGGDRDGGARGLGALLASPESRSALVELARDLRAAGVRRMLVDGVELELLPPAPEKVRMSGEDLDAYERRVRAEVEAENARLLYWSA